MRRGLFGSSPVNKRNGSSNKSKPEDKRRSFAFMRYGSNRPANQSMRQRTREHARQIALQLSQEGEASEANDDTPKMENYGFFSTTPPSKQRSQEQVEKSPRKNFAPNWGALEEVTPKDSLDSMDKGKREPRKRMSLDEFVEHQQQMATPRKGATSVVSENTGRDRYSDRTVRSMPTLPSNSTMLARNITSPQSSDSATNAAARRRMRRRQRESIEHSYQTMGEDEFFEQSPSFQSMRETSVESSRSIGSYGSGSAGKPPKPSPTSKSIVHTPGAASTSNSTSSGNSQQNFMMDVDHGFSFDAFGLDENQVDREVNAAIQDLAGDHPDLFFQDEFPVQSFDSPEGSRASTPDNLDEDGFENGFRISGLPNLPLHVKQSPASSDRSSLTSSTEKQGDGQINQFKEQAGFFRSKPSPIKLPPSPSRRTPSPAFHQNAFKSPPRQKNAITHSPSPQGFGAWADFSSSGFPSGGKSEPGVPHMPKMPQLEQDDGFGDFAKGTIGGDVEWGTPKERSDTGTNSDFFSSDGGIQSDAGVDSEAGRNSDISVVPEEVLSKRKHKKKSDSSPGSREEKKDEDFDPNTSSVSEMKKSWEVRTTKSAPSTPQREVHKLRHRSPVSGLRQAWERRTSEELDQDTVLVPQRQRARSLIRQRDAGQDQPEDATLSPGTVERKWPKEVNQQQQQRQPTLSPVQRKGTPMQQQRAAECVEQRTSFASHRERLKPAHLRNDEKTDVYASNSGSFERGSVTPRVKSFSPSFESSQESSFEFTERASPLFANVKLRKTGAMSQTGESQFEQPKEQYESGSRSAPVGWNEGNYGGKLDDEQPDAVNLPYRQRMSQEYTEQEEEPQVAPPPKKLTYRERREIELRQQEEERARKEAESNAQKKPERDVASLIRRRIAANKRTAAQAAQTEGSKGGDFSNMRNRLRKVSMESKITQLRPSAPAREHEPVVAPEPEVLRTPAAPISVVFRQAPTDGDQIASVPSSDPSEPSEASAQQSEAAPQMSLATLMASRAAAMAPKPAKKPSVPDKESISASSNSTKAKLDNFLAHRLADGVSLASLSKDEDDNDKNALVKSKQQQKRTEAPTASTMPSPALAKESKSVSVSVDPPAEAFGGRPALKNDPKYDRYFRMLKVGMPMEVVKHAMTRDGVDPSVMDGDHNKPAGHAGGVPLKDDPKYEKYFKMLKIGLPMGAVKNAMERDGLDPAVMDHDHNLPANTKGGSDGNAQKENRPKDKYRRTRLHWETVRKVRSNSVWAKIDEDQEVQELDIDEQEFKELFQAELIPSATAKNRNTAAGKRGAAVRVIDSKRANNGGIILARLKMGHDELADAVDRIDDSTMSSQQMQNIIEYLPTAEERTALEAYMLAGGTDAAEKFEGLCECEKFMVAMMTVKHAKRKVRALLFKVQFGDCIESLEQDAAIVERACDELSNSVRLRKLMGIVLNIGNRLNTAGVSSKRKAGAFTVESLLKLNQAKAFDKKTTFLHYIVLVVQRNNELLLRFKDDLPTVMKADKVYWDQVVSDLEEVENQLENVRRVALHQATLSFKFSLKKKKKKARADDDDNDSLSDSSLSLEEEVEALRATAIGHFTLNAIKQVSSLRDKVETTKAKFGCLLEYFGEDERQEMQPHELFNIICTFCRDFDKAKEVVFENIRRKKREERKKQASMTSDSKQVSMTNGSRAATGRARRNAPALRASSMQPTISGLMKQSNLSPKNGTQSPRPSQPKQSQPNKQPQNRQQSLPNASGEMPQQESFEADFSRQPAPPVAPQVAPQRSASLTPPQRQRPRIKYNPPQDLQPATDKTSSVNRTQSTVKTDPMSMRHRARLRRQRMQGRSNSGTSSVSTATTAASSVAPVAPVSEVPKAQPNPQTKVDQSALSPRSNIRHRRRLEQRQRAARQAAQQSS